MHSLRMFGQAMRYVLLIALSLWLVTFVALALVKTSSYDRYIITEYLQAQIKLEIHDKNVLHEFNTHNGRKVTLKAIDFIHHPKTQASLIRFLKGVEFSLFYSLILSFSCVIIGAFWFLIRGKEQRATTQLRGGTKTDPKSLAKLIKQDKRASKFRLAKVPLIKDSEMQHILVTGTTGTGKSVCLLELMDQVRAKGQRAIVYDIEGAFIPLYYRSGMDVILNPLDERSPPWNVWQECQDAADFETIASSLMPMQHAGGDPFWIHSARSIFAVAALELDQKNKRQNKALLSPLFSENLTALTDLLKGSSAEALISDKNEKTALSIKATLSTYCKALTYLKDDISGPLFSIRKWVEEDKEDSWLFISANTLKMDALKPLLSVWLDVAAKSILSLPPSSNRRIWVFLDELASLHRLPSLINVLSRCRKYGGCFVSAIQDIHQLRALYGRDEAEVLTSLFNTHLCFRTNGPESSAWMSKMMGYREIIEHKEGLSYGANEVRDSVSIHQDRRREPIIMDSEFLELENLHAYLKLPGSWPIAKLIFEIKKRQPKEPVLIPRKIQAEQFSTAIPNAVTVDKNHFDLMDELLK